MLTETKGVRYLGVNRPSPKIPLLGRANFASRIPFGYLTGSARWTLARAACRPAPMSQRGVTRVTAKAGGEACTRSRAAGFL